MVFKKQKENNIKKDSQSIASGSQILLIFSGAILGIVTIIVIAVLIFF